MAVRKVGVMGDTIVLQLGKCCPGDGFRYVQTLAVGRAYGQRGLDIYIRMRVGLKLSPSKGEIVYEKSI